jgi:hypothetical protein
LLGYIKEDVMRLISCIALTSLMAASSAFAHHDGKGPVGSVRIPQPVVAGGTLLEPGVYEIRDTGEHVVPMPGQSPDAEAYIEFVRDGTVVAREVAELTSQEGRPIGTSVTAPPAIRFEVLKGGDFARVSFTRGGERYLIYLPTK